MAEGSRSSKRRRTSVASPKLFAIIGVGEEFEPAEGQDTFTFDFYFWLLDGNIILRAGHSALRVYRGILAQKSPVFRHMFDTRPLDAAETFNGRPVVRLSDHPEDLTDFLQYLIPCTDFE